MKYTFESLVEILATLRSEKGCPWDRAQNVSSLLPYLIEESYEYIDAAIEKDASHMQEELGDILLQVVFHAQVCKEEGKFSIEDVVQGISEKMVRRHPHVFGNAEASTTTAVQKQWETIKATEQEGNPKSTMDKVPKSMPSLTKAQELQRRAAKSGFDWKHAEDSFEKVLEEIKEFKEEKQREIFLEKDKLEEEFGDLLFSLINYGRHCGINASVALERANVKFESRYRCMEKLAAKDLKAASEMELLELWQRAKQEN